MKIFYPIMLLTVAITPFLSTSATDGEKMYSWQSIASGNHKNALDNPAHMANSKPHEKFSFRLKASAFAIDPRSIIDDIEELEDEINTFDDKLDLGIATYEDGTNLAKMLEDLGGTEATAVVEGGVLFSIPNLIETPIGNIPLGFFNKTKAKIGSTFTYDPKDANRITASILDQYVAEIDPDNTLFSQELKSDLRKEILDYQIDLTKTADDIISDIETIVAKYPGYVAEVEGVDESNLKQFLDKLENLDFDDITLDLASNLRADSVFISEFGIMTGHEFQVPNRSISFDVGIALKYQYIALVQEFLTPSEVDDYSFDLDKNLTEKNHFNIDLGVTASIGEGGRYKVGLLAQNLIPTEIEGILGDVYHLRPQVILGLGYEHSWYGLNATVDLLKNEGFGSIKESQNVSISAQVTPSQFDWASFRVGYKHDMTGNYDGVATAGFTLNPWKERIIVSFDGELTGNDEYGAKLGIGFSF